VRFSRNWSVNWIGILHSLRSEVTSRRSQRWAHPSDCGQCTRWCRPALPGRTLPRTSWRRAASPVTILFRLAQVFAQQAFAVLVESGRSWSDPFIVATLTVLLRFTDFKSICAPCAYRVSARNLFAVKAARRSVEWPQWKRARRLGSATYRASQSIGDDGTQQR